MKDLFNSQHIWKLKDWMRDKVDFDKLGVNRRALYMIECNPEISAWPYLSQFPDALYLLKKNPDKIHWNSFNKNDSSYFFIKNKYPDHLDQKYVYRFPSAIKYIEEQIQHHIQDVNWEYLSWNPSAIHLLKRYRDKIKWNYLAMNPNPEAVDLMKEEMEEILQNPNDEKYRLFWYCLIGNSYNPRVKEIFIEYIDRIKDPNMHRITERRDVELLPYFEKKIQEILLKMDLGIHLDTIVDFDMKLLSKNPIAVDLLLKYEKIIDWYSFSVNPNPKAIAYLKEHPEKIQWNFMVENRSDEAMELVKEKVIKGDISGFILKGLSGNPYIFQLDYDFLFNRMNIIREELIEKAWHPLRFEKWCI